MKVEWSAKIEPCSRTFQDCHSRNNFEKEDRTSAMERLEVVCLAKELYSVAHTLKRSKIEGCPQRKHGGLRLLWPRYTRRTDLEHFSKKRRDAAERCMKLKRPESSLVCSSCRLKIRRLDHNGAPVIVLMMTHTGVGGFDA